MEANIPGVGYSRIEVEGEVISSVQHIGALRFDKLFVSPAFIDVQVNGFSGVDFSSPTLTPEEVVSVLPAFWKTGVTTLCPTLITNTTEKLLKNLGVLERARTMSADFDAAAPCYHLEGPYLSTQSRGVHDSDLIRNPDWEEFSRLQTAATGRIKVVTLAPELPGALDFIRKATTSGVVVAIGHTNATPEQIHDAARVGCTLSTHWGNGCPQQIHRHNNPLWAQLAIDTLSISMICDGFHLPPDVVNIAARVKGLDRCILITDAVHVANLPVGRYKLLGASIELLPSGQVVTVDRRCMAGSSVTLDRAVATFQKFARVSLSAALQAATRNPARLIGRPEACFAVAKGQPANLVFFTRTEDRLQIETVLFRGRTVVSRNGEAHA